MRLAYWWGRIFLIALCAVITASAESGDAATYPLEVLPSEARIDKDPVTGAKLTYLTTDAGTDTNLYFHERSWSYDSSFIVFYSTREKGGLMGYVVATGELFRIDTPAGPLGSATCGINRNCVFGLRGNELVELKISVAPSKNPKRKHSIVTANERVLATLPACTASTALNENCDGTKLAVGRFGAPEGQNPVILTIDEDTGAVREAMRVPTPPQFSYHVQWSHTSPNLLSFAGLYPRINVLDVTTGKVTVPYDQLRNELVTHEHWWVNDQIVFCSGSHPQPAEDSHVKIVDVKTGVVRILAAGSWWPGGTDEEIAKQNFWHCSGSDDGRWVAADNWHGDITLIEGKNARPMTLTSGHRNYGSGEHPHVGWDRKGEQVIFTSHKLGNADICVATIPKSMQDANTTSPVTEP